jgi:PEP-CTERM motif
MKRTFLALCASVSALAVSPAMAAETINVSFTQPDGGVTTGLYSGTVNVRVSGIGNSLSILTNDAFYIFDRSGFGHDSSFYQLTFGTNPLVGFTPSQNAVNFVVGGLPAYQPSHIYNFLLNTGTATPKALHFGVGDGIFSDNGGGFVVTIAGVPEPANWAMMIAGFGLAGAAMRRRTKLAVTYA